MLNLSYKHKSLPQDVLLNLKYYVKETVMMFI